MKLECVKEKLQNAVMTADRAAGKNLSLPILSNILLSAEKSGLRIRATNLELGVEIKVPAKVETEGKVVVSGSVLGSLLSGIVGEKNIMLDLQDKNLVVVSHGNIARIKTQPADDFPTIPKIENGIEVEISAQAFVEGVKSVWYSTSVSTVKPEIASVYIYPEKGKLIFAATDSFRLAERVLEPKKAILESPVLIPQKNLIEIVRIIETFPESVHIISTKNQIAFITDGTYITSRVIDGVFPDYRQIIPKEYKTEAIMLKQDIISALRVTNLFSDKFHKISFLVNPEGGEFKVAAFNTDIGENTTTIDATLSGDPLTISFNHRYVLDCFQSIKDDSVVFRFNGEGRPLVIQGVKEKGFLYLVMPMNR